MSIKLKDLVRNVRACKTAAEERAVITKECALIRTAFKDEDAVYRQRNVAKLLFIHLLGYPTHFAQIDCLKLIASNRFSEKRIGYLGLTQFLDDTAEILMLVTNSVGNDLQHPNQYVNGLALTALANLGNAEMCMALAREVDQLMGVANPYIRKKATLCAIRVVTEVEEVRDKFSHHIPSLLEDRNHGVLIAACTFMLKLLELDRSYNVKQFRKHVSQIIRLLQNLMTTGHSAAPDYDIGGITDPFLQARLLELLRELGHGSHKKSDQMSDMLAQVATNTDSSKTVGNALLYEAVRAIMHVEAESGLRVMGVNILGRFLQNKDSNIRCVALAVMQNVVKIDLKSVQRHRSTVLECLKDIDVSTRRRALDVTFALINEDNIKTMTKELVNLLLLTDDEFKPDLVSKICLAVDKYAPNRRWQIDSLIRAMCLAGNFVPETVRDNFIHVVGASPELQEYAVHKLYFSVRENLYQETLVQVAVWCIGEFGDLLVAGNVTSPDGTPVKILPSDVLDLLETIASRPMGGDVSVGVSKNGNSGGNSPTTSNTASTTQIGVFTSSSQFTTTELLLMAYLKLSSRCPSESSRIQSFLQRYSRSFNVELQQRACEFDQLMRSSLNEGKEIILERMPIPTDRARYVASRPTGDAAIDEVPPPLSNGKVALSAAAANNLKSGGGANLLDLDALLDMGGGTTPVAATPGAELLADLLGGLQTPSAPPVPLSGSPEAGDFAASLGDVTGSSSKEAPLVAFEKNGLKVLFLFPDGITPGSSTVTVEVQSLNDTEAPMTKYMFEVAVPKYMKLEMQPASADVIPASQCGRVTQRMTIEFASARELSKPVAVRLRISYMHKGTQVQELGHVSSLHSRLL